MVKPLVSIIIPVFNAEKSLARCIRSILNQSFNKDLYEIILLDDASTDNSSLIWSSMSNELIVLANKTNRGLPYCLNKAIQASSGDYFLRLDSDDYVNEFYVEALYNFLTMNEHYDAVSCDYFEVTEKEEVIMRKNSLEEPIGCGIIFQKSHWLEIGKYDSELRIHEEVDFLLRFKKQYKLGHLEMPLYRYRQHSSNMTKDKKEVERFAKKLSEKHEKI